MARCCSLSTKHTHAARGANSIRTSAKRDEIGALRVTYKSFECVGNADGFRVDGERMRRTQDRPHLGCSHTIGVDVLRRDGIWWYFEDNISRMGREDREISPQLTGANVKQNACQKHNPNNGS